MIPRALSCSFEAAGRPNHEPFWLDSTFPNSVSCVLISLHSNTVIIWGSMHIPFHMAMNPTVNHAWCTLLLFWSCWETKSWAFLAWLQHFQIQPVVCWYHHNHSLKHAHSFSYGHESHCQLCLVHSLALLKLLGDQTSISGQVRKLVRKHWFFGVCQKAFFGLINGCLREPALVR